MSDISSNHERIVKSPINRSKSKHLYSFSKSIRFDDIKSQSSKTFSYELPTLKNRRSTSLGYGKKFDFIIKHINKKVPFYDIPSDFNAKKPPTPAFSFGIGRQFYDKVVAVSGSGNILDKNIPGPGRYNHTKPLGADALKFSLFGRSGGTKIFDKILNNPGPGEYDHLNIKNSGKYPVSHFRNTTNSIQWLNDKESRFSDKKNNTPGPGHYKPKNHIDGSGTTFISRYKSSTAKSLGGRLRELSNKNPTPGPGTYDSFSEFGFYQTKQSRKSSEKEFSTSKSFFDKSKRSQYLSERKALSNGFIKFSKSDKFNRDYRDESEKPSSNYLKFLEVDEEKILSKKVKQNEYINLKASDYNLRFDNNEPEKKTQHISELDIKQNDESEAKDDSSKTRSQKENTKGSNNDNYNNNIKPASDKNNFKRIDNTNVKKTSDKSIFNKSSSNMMEKKVSEQMTKNNMEMSLKNEAAVKISDKNIDVNYKNKNEEISKVSGSQNINESKSLNSFKIQSKHNREEFLRRTENSEKSKKLTVSNNNNNSVILNHNASMKSDQFKIGEMNTKVNSDYKNNSESKSNKSNFSKVSFNNSVGANNRNIVNNSNLGMSYIGVSQNSKINPEE